jgi:hypothetical protein
MTRSGSGRIQVFKLVYADDLFFHFPNAELLALWTLPKLITRVKDRFLTATFGSVQT